MSRIHRRNPRHGRRRSERARSWLGLLEEERRRLDEALRPLRGMAPKATQVIVDDAQLVDEVLQRAYPAVDYQGEPLTFALAKLGEPQDCPECGGHHAPAQACSWVRR